MIPKLSLEFLKTLSILATALLLSLLHTPAQAQEIKEFTSDGCSAFPDGTLAHNDLWLQCCVAHDFAYWKGGTYAERESADQQLLNCVSDVGEPHIAAIMLAGVRVGGSPYWPTRFRWGYGWSYPRLYKTLSEQERQAVKLAMAELDKSIKASLDAAGVVFTDN